MSVYEKFKCSAIARFVPCLALPMTCCKVKRGANYILVAAAQGSFAWSPKLAMFVWEVHLCTVKVAWLCCARWKSRLFAAGAKIGRWGNLERFLFGHIAAVILHRNYGILLHLLWKFGAG